jgi:hypothetical protein
VLHVDQLHLQGELLDAAQADPKLLAFLVVDSGQLAGVAGGHGAEDLTLGSLFESLQNGGAGLTKDLSCLQASIGADDDVAPPSILLFIRDREHP